MRLNQGKAKAGSLIMKAAAIAYLITMKDNSPIPPETKQENMETKVTIGF